MVHQGLQHSQCHAAACGARAAAVPGLGFLMVSSRSPLIKTVRRPASTVQELEEQQEEDEAETLGVRACGRKKMPQCARAPSRLVMRTRWTLAQVRLIPLRRRPFTPGGRPQNLITVALAGAQDKSVRFRPPCRVAQ